MSFDIVSLAFGSSDDHPASKDGWRNFTPDGALQYCSFKPTSEKPKLDNTDQKAKDSED